MSDGAPSGHSSSDAGLEADREPTSGRTVSDDIAALSFEAAMTELETIVRDLEQGSGSLDAAIDAYARGAALKTHCEAKLKEARLRIDRIVLNEDGSAPAGTEDANIEL